MNPVMFTIGNFEIRWYSVLILIGVLSFGAYKVYEKVIEVYEPYKEIVDKYNETDKTIKSITDIFK